MDISLDHLGKQYGKHWIFEGVSAQFESGKRYAIIGSNGSGKSTLLQIISGYVSPNKGEIHYIQNGQQLPIEEWYKYQAIAAPYLDLMEEFNVEETFLLHSKLKPLRKPFAEIISEIELQGHQDKSLSKLSSGMKQRIKLALAIYSVSEVLLLDEPTSNLDRKWTQWFQETVLSNSADRLIITCTNSQEQELAICTEAPIDLSAKS